MAKWAQSVIGQTLARSYRVERFLGVGTVGAVYVARHVRTGALCAIKLLHRKIQVGVDMQQRFLDEMRLLGALRHPHVLAINDFDRDDNGTPFFVMDLLEGENLQQRLTLKGSLPLSQVLEIASQTGSALASAHRIGILHRNLKPENVFLQRHDLGDYVSEMVKVADFGQSRFRRHGPGQGKSDSLSLGATQYTAPELHKDPDARGDPRADQWALGVVVYRMLTGRLPFEGSDGKIVLARLLGEEPTPLAQLAPELPEGVAQAVARALARRKEDRFESVAEFVKVLRGRPLSGHPSAAMPAVPAPSPAPPAPSLKTPPVLAAGASGREAPSGRSPGPLPPPHRSAGPPTRFVAAAIVLGMLAGGATTLLLWRSQRLGSPSRLPPAPGPAQTPALAQAPLPPAPLPVDASAAPPAPVPVATAAPAGEAPPPAAVPDAGVAVAQAGPKKEAKTEPEAPARPAAERPRRRAAEEGAEQGPPPPPVYVEHSLKDAQDAYVAGDRYRAVVWAMSVANQGGPDSPAAWRFVAAAACSLDDPRLATRAARRLGAEELRLVTSICRKSGLIYVDGEFRKDGLAGK